MSYIDMLERSDSEERRRQREIKIMEEGKYGSIDLDMHPTNILNDSRALWERKKKEEEDLLFRDLEELKELSRARMFGRPGHGAPTTDIR